MSADPFAAGPLSVSGKRWTLRAVDERLALTHAQRLGVPEIVGRLLAGRGVGLDAADDFLNPRLKTLMPDPSRLADMEKAAARLADAIEAGEGVAVFGDYDVDGATSSALIVRYFRALGRDVTLYIPDRMREGYGPNAAAMRTLAKGGARVIVTVDCGTLAFAALDAAAEAGADVIVCDHHAPGERLPRAHAVVNPNRADDLSEQGHLAAAGVTFLLLAAVSRALRQRGFFASRAEPDLLALLDIVALGTVCDVVPLKGLNRAFVTQGLRVLARTGHPGLAALMAAAGVKGVPGAYHLGFLLGPRINAGGRIAEGGLGARLLTTDDAEEARLLAMQLDRLNRERQAIEGAILDHAYEAGARCATLPAFVAVAGETYHPGVIGIVAGRLKERFEAPAFVFALDGGVAKGSARSIPGVDVGAAVHEALALGLLASGGGHAMAAGLTLPREGLPALYQFLGERLSGAVAAARSDSYPLDCLVTAEGATSDLVAAMGRVGPFGAGNPEPRVAVPGVRLVHADIVGGDHVRAVAVGESGARVKTIAFRSATTPLGEALLKGVGRPLALAGRLSRDDWNGREGVQLIVDDAVAA